MRVLLHLGQHKTGSKALQSALYANREFLAAGGFTYPIARRWRTPRPQELNHFPLFERLRTELATKAPHSRRVAAVRELLHPLLLRPETGAETVILSSEDLFDMHTAHEAQFVPERIVEGARLLAEALAGLAEEICLVCYLRRQDHLLGAHYAQFIKGSGRVHPEFAEFHQLFAARLDAAALLAPWETTFGLDRVTVVPYEPRAMPEGIVGDFFGRILGLGLPPASEPFPGDPEAFNFTPNRDDIEFMRYLNRRSARGRRVVHRAQVLDAAFHDRQGAASGISAWMSPAERVELLARYEPGNRLIARRHALGETLFQEPWPNATQAWTPPPELDLPRLVELDSRPRQFTGQLPWWRRLLGKARSWAQGRQAWWILPPEAAAADRKLAARLFAGVAGCPELETQLGPSMASLSATSRRRSVSLVVLVGPLAAASLTANDVKELRNHRARVVLLVGECPGDASQLEAIRSLAFDVTAVICATRAVRDALTAALPALRSIPLHLLPDAEEPPPETLESIARI